MIELPVGRAFPKHQQHVDPRDVNGMFRFRKLCEDRKETGLLTMGIGEAYWINEDGDFMDDNIPPAIVELEELWEHFYR